MSRLPGPGEFDLQGRNGPTERLPRASGSRQPPEGPRAPLPLPYAGQETDVLPPAPRLVSRPPGQATPPPMPRSGFHDNPLTRPPAYERAWEYPASPVRRRSKWSRRLLAFALIAGLLILLLGGLAVHRISDFGQAISKQAPFSTQTNFMTGNGRINLLVLGYGGAGHDGAYLTDSIVLISLIPSDHATTVISVPRDLWVQIPPNSGQYAKINAAYQDGLYNGYNGMPAGRDAGGQEAADKVSAVVGLPITYWLTMDFGGFRSLVDALGGVDINVPVGFTARYPANDDPTINPNWKIIHFNAGPQHMDGEQAIEYARARYVLSPLSQASDFARSVRQQLLITAILSRAKQIDAWPGLLDATTALQNAIYTNLSVTDLALFGEKLNFAHAAHIGLSDQNVLVGSQSSDGQDILLPANGDWSSIQQYVASNLKT
jgi:polyisoprenyl-teichoic acid--peptidoglycan teichoic acid transferase